MWNSVSTFFSSQEKKSSPGYKETQVSYPVSTTYLLWDIACVPKYHVLNGIKTSHFEFVLQRSINKVGLLIPSSCLGSTKTEAIKSVY